MRDYRLDELKDVLQAEGKLNNIQMPSEAVDIIAKSDKFKGYESGHRAVAYSYLYLITWLYKNAGYRDMDVDMVSLREFKGFLGIEPEDNLYDYIILKDGVLDELELTETKPFGEAPTTWNQGGWDEETMYRVFRDERKYDRKYIRYGGTIGSRTIKYPVLAFKDRVINNEIVPGTFLPGGYKYTHKVSFETFAEMMTNKELGPIAFYVYAFIGSWVDWRTGGLQMRLKTMVEQSGVTINTLQKTIDKLEEYGFVRKEKGVTVKTSEGFSRSANTYYITTNEDRLVEGAR